MDTIDEFTFYFPDLTEELRATPYLRTNFGSRPKALDKAIRLMSLLYVGNETKGGFIQLSSRKMAEMFGGNTSWQRVVAALENADWIERKHRYRVATIDKKAICKGYRLTAKALRNGWIIEKVRKPQLEKLDDRPVLEGVTLDKAEALRILESLTSPPLKKGKIDCPVRRKARIRVKIENFSSKFSIGKTGRLSTSSNGLKKELRSAVRINGSSVDEIDVKNCHPLLLATLYPENSLEAISYVALVENGKLYEDIMSFHGAPLGPKTRGQFKRGFVTWLGGGKNPQTFHYMKEKWPELFGIFMENIAVNKKAVCFYLQRLESAIIVKEFPALFGRQCISVHDGVLIEASEKENAATILTEIFKEWHGLNPTLH